MVDLDLRFFHAVMRTSEIAYVAIVVLGLWLVTTRHTSSRHRLMVAAFAVSLLFIGIQAATDGTNQWLNTIWPRFQGGLFLAALTTGKRWRVLAFAIPPALSTWLMVYTNGSTPLAEKTVELSVFIAVAILATRQLRTDPLIGLALLVYSIPTIIASPVLILLANLKAWIVWLDVFQVVHAGRIFGIVLCAAWFWRSTAPRKPQLELWPA